MAAFGLTLGLWLIGGSLTELAQRMRLGAAPLTESLRRLGRLPRGTLHPGVPLSLLPSRGLEDAGASRSVSPGAGNESRLPVRHKLYCEALTGVADPVTT